MTCRCVDPAVCVRRQKYYATEVDVTGCRVAASRIGGAGDGLFATREYKRGDLITYYSGCHTDAQPEGDRVLDVSARLSIDAAGPCAHPNAAGDKINHHAIETRRNCRYTFNPSRVRNPMRLAAVVATRRIRPGDEFYLSYGSTYRAAFVRHGE